MLTSGGGFFLYMGRRMKYTKPPLTFEQQADLLISRGLIADKSTLITRLKSVSYYRMSGYLYPFRNPNDTFKPGTTLDRIWQRYTFDRQLRLSVLKFLLNQIAPQSFWPKRLINLMERYPDVPRKPMGFGENWRECPIWKIVWTLITRTIGLPWWK